MRNGRLIGALLLDDPDGLPAEEDDPWLTDENGQLDAHSVSSGEADAKPNVPCAGVLDPRPSKTPQVRSAVGHHRVLQAKAKHVPKPVPSSRHAPKLAPAAKARAHVLLKPTPKQAPQPEQAASVNKKWQHCWTFWYRGKCNRDNCQYVHEEKPPASQARTPRDRSRSPRRTGEKAAWAAEEEDEIAVSCGDGCFWSTPRKLLSWRDPSGNDQALLGGAGVVDFHAALVVPGAEKPPENEEDRDALLLHGDPDARGLPVAFFFPGLGMDSRYAILGKYQEWAAAAPEPFIVVAPNRQPGRWWFIDDDGHWGWIAGEFRPEAANLVAAWAQALVGRPGVDVDRVGLFGFSAGAYACCELLATGRMPQVTGVGLGGVHGHGQPDLDDLPTKRREGVVEKFADFTRRLSQHDGAPWIEATHANSDQQSRWEDAAAVLGALTARQRQLGLPEVSVRIIVDPEQHDIAAGSRKNKSHHEYFGAAFQRTEFFVALFGGKAPPPSPLPRGLSLVLPDLDDPQAAAVARAPLAPPPTSLEVEQYSVSCEDTPFWQEAAFAIFEEHGFVIVKDLLKLHQYTSVLRDCERAAKDIVGSDRRGNRGPGRYSFGVASATGSMLHVPSFARHLLDSAGALLRPLLDQIFAGGDQPGFQVIAGGGDFVLGDTRTHQDLHSDIHVNRQQNKKLPPPLLSVNYCVQELTNANGPTRIVPGTQLEGGLNSETEPVEWRSSRLCPIPAGAAIVRDVRVLHGGTPNMTPKTRYLPSIEYVSADLRASNRKDKFPPTRSLPWKFFDKLPSEVKDLCQEIAAPEGKAMKVEYNRR